MSGPGELQPIVPPILRRTSTRDFERQQFQTAQQQAVGEVAASGQGWPAIILKFFMNLVFVGVACCCCYLYFGTVWILFFHMEQPCDQPLGIWLVLWFILPSILALVDPPTQESDYLELQDQQDARRRRTHRQLFVHSSWFLVGYLWLANVKTCQSTNPDLYHWVHLVIHVYLVVMWMFILFPFFIMVGVGIGMRVFQSLIERGWIKNPNGARADTIDGMRVVDYDKTLFADESDPTDKRPTGECCCCTECFNAEKEIVCTPCDHYFHKECLGEWLKLARTCPLCRKDLDETVALEKDLETGLHPISEGSQVLTGDDGESDEAMARRLQAEELQTT